MNETPIDYAARVAQCGRRLIFQNRNVLSLHERLQAKGIVHPRPWPMEFQGETFASAEQARREFRGGGATRFFDTWEEAEAWLYEEDDNGD